MSDFDGAASADSGAVIPDTPVVAETPNPISVDNEDHSPKPEPKAEKVEAKPETPRDALKRAADKVASMDRPADKTTPIKDGGPVRDEAGKFAAKEGDKPKSESRTEPKTEAKQPDAKAGEAPDASKPSTEARASDQKDATSEAAKPADAPKPSFTASEPPSRFSPDAKRDWATAPETVRAETERAIKELTKGYEQYKTAAERDRSLQEFHELAHRGGTDLKTALSRYVGMENALRQDPIKGLELVLQNIGMTPRQYAERVLGQPADQQQSQADATIMELRQQVARLEQMVGGVTQTFEQQRAQTTHEAVSKFAADHPRFEELSEDIVFFLKTRCPGNLEEAYQLAERLNPAPAPVVSETTSPAASSAPAPAPKPAPVPDVSAHTERGRKSIAGSPTPGSAPATRKQPSSSIKDSLKKAFAQAG